MNNKIEFNLESFSSIIITGLMVVIMFFLTAVSLLFRSYIDVTYQEIIYYRWDNVILELVVLAGFLMGLFLLSKKGLLKRIPERPLLLLLLLYTAFVSGLWAYVSHSYPVADQKSVLDCVKGLMNGNYRSMEYKGYLQYNQHQVGLTAFYELFFRIFTRSVVSYKAVYVLNTVFIVLTFLGLHLITKELTQQKEIRILELVLSFGLLQLMLYSTFVYGLIPGLCFSVYGIWGMLKLLRTGRLIFGVMTALMTALAVVMKSNYYIIFLAVSIVLAVKSVSWKRWWYLGVIAGAVVVILLIGQSARMVYEERSGIKFGDTIPNVAYVAMGMQEGAMAPGWFNGYNHMTYRENGYNEAVTAEISKQYISERLKEFMQNPVECLEFYYKKIVSQWNEVTYECFWISTNENNHSRELSGTVQSLYTGKLHTAAEAFMNLYQLILFAGTFIFAWSFRKNKELETKILLLCILGGFLFHILWEGKSQYLISYIPLMMPCAAIGMGKATLQE